jgi:hypothetical protein
VEGEALVSDEGFSPRYDLDRWSGLITKPGHKLEGLSIVDKICFFPTAKGATSSKASASSTRSAFSPPRRAASPPAGRSTTSSGRKSRRRRSSLA